jgi:hypothetical protein
MAGSHDPPRARSRFAGRTSTPRHQPPKRCNSLGDYSPEFKSRRPDYKKAALVRAFSVAWRCRVVVRLRGAPPLRVLNVCSLTGTAKGSDTQLADRCKQLE